MSVKVLAFCTHTPINPDVEEVIAQALDWGVDVFAAQGTSTDWGPYWLGSGKQVNTRTNLKENMRPYLRAAIKHKKPFVCSVGLAGGDIHLQEALDRIDELCVEEGWQIKIGVISGEIPPDYLKDALRSAVKIPAAFKHRDLSPWLTEADVDQSIRIVGLLGPEVIMEVLSGEPVDGVITGRALDIGLHMAIPMLRGVPRAVAAYAGKVIECAGIACERGSAQNPLWAEIDETGFTVRSPKSECPATPQSLSAHGFYERTNPWREANPGGSLDLSDVTITDLGDGKVRCEGARWIDAPYSVLIEGAKLLGYRTVATATALDPAFKANIDLLISDMYSTIDSVPQLADHKRGGDFDLTVKVFGGGKDDEPMALIVNAVANTQQLAELAAFIGYSYLHAGHYPGRLTTGGNLSFPYMPILQPYGPVYAFSICHILPLDNPSGPFRSERISFPRTTLAATAGTSL